MTADRRRRRALLMTPASTPERLERARRAGADCVVADLEDSVPPGRKEEARGVVRTFLASAGESGPALGVRVNAPATPDGIRDLAALGACPSRPALVVVPKVESPRDLDIVAGALAHDGRTPELYALVETPLGIARACAIARAERLSGVVFGAADYAALVGCGMGWGPLLYARSALANAAHTTGILAIDSPFFDLGDPAGLKEEAEQARMLGYWTKGAVHPGQLPVIRAAFRPSAQEVDAARAVLAAGRRSGDGITSVDGRMVGTPFFASARSLIGGLDDTGDAHDGP